jgi:hypothetical protein
LCDSFACAAVAADVDADVEADCDTDVEADVDDETAAVRPQRK